MKKCVFFYIVIVISGSVYFASMGFAHDFRNAVDANNRFAFDLYARYKSSDDNIFFSPYSIFSAMSITYEGTRGDTAEEIRRLFYLPEDKLT